MRKRLTRSKRFKMTLLSSLFVLVSVPMVMYALLSTESTDTRSSADFDPEYCTISFPFVNSQTVQAGAIVSLEMVAVPPEGETITSIKVTTTEEEVLFDEIYSEYQSYIAERTTYTTEETGPIGISGIMTTDVSSYVCKLTDSIDNSLRVLAMNDAPEFTSDPDNAEPSNALVVGDTYRYELSATDSDGDDIEYSYSFTPRADWLTMSIIESGEDGSLRLLFEGITDEPASYLANIFIHDGYNQHLRSQSWVISVDPAENDIPIVTVTRPTAGTTVKQGDNIVTAWTATDQNQIIGYKLFYSKNPGKAEQWVAIDKNISYRDSTYVVDTSEMVAGQYQFIVQATDNQNPPGVGSGVSERFTIESDTPTPPRPEPEPDEPDPTPAPEPEPEPDDGPVIEEPQIVNVSPADKSTITDLRQIISATLIAGADASIVADTITFKVDGIDMTEQIEESSISNSEMTIIYTPSSDYEAGEHKVEVSFADNDGGIGMREWSFTMEENVIDEDSIDIFGYRISKRTMWIIMIGLALIILAIAIPWIIYMVWKNDDDEPTDDSVYSTPPSSLPPSTWSSAHRFHDTKPIIDTPTTRKVEEQRKKEKAAARAKAFKKPEPKPIPQQKEPEPNKEESKGEYNTITGGIINKPTFQTLDKKDPEVKKTEPNKQEDKKVDKSTLVQPKPQQNKPVPKAPFAPPMIQQQKPKQVQPPTKPPAKPQTKPVPQKEEPPKKPVMKVLKPEDKQEPQKPAPLPKQPQLKKPENKPAPKEDKKVDKSALMQTQMPSKAPAPKPTDKKPGLPKKDESLLPRTTPEEPKTVIKKEPKEALKVSKDDKKVDSPEVWKPRVIIPPSKSN